MIPNTPTNMLNYKKHILLVLLLVCSSFGFAQIRFNKVYDFVDTDSFRYNNIGIDFLELNDSNYLMTRVTANERIIDTLNFTKYYFLITKLDKYGNCLDSNKFNIKGKRVALNNLVQTNSGVKFAIGWILDYKKYIDSNIYSDVFLVKLTNDGDTIWTKKYSLGNGNDYINDVATTEDGNIIIFGTSCNQNESDCDVFILKLDTNGNVLIKQKYTYTSSSVEYAGGIQIKNNNIYLLASSNGDTTGVKAEIFKINRLGQLVSISRLSTISDFENSFYTEDLLIDKDGGFVIVGQELDDHSWTFTGHIAKLDSNFNLLWQQTISNSIGSDYTSILVYSNNYYVAGNRLNTQNEFANPYLTSFTKNGTIRFDRKINFPNSTLETGLTYNMKLTGDKGISGVGFAADTNNLRKQYTWFFKTDTLGCFVDGCTFNGLEADVKVHDIIVYPNPASDKLFMYGVEGKDIEIVDIQGRLMLKSTYDFNGIDLSSLLPGLYSVKVNFGNQFVYRKFVKY